MRLASTLRSGGAVDAGRARGRVRAAAAAPGGARHPDLMQRSADPLRPVEVRPRHNQEADERYRRVDNSAELAAESRLAFARCLAGGEAQLDLARAALWVAAEDDAIASSSIVRFPVEAFMQRIQRLAGDTAAALAAAAAAAAAASEPPQPQAPGPGGGQWAALRAMPPAQVVAGVEHVLFGQQPQQQAQAQEEQQQQQQQQQAQQQQQQQQQAQQQAQPAPWYAAAPCSGFRVSGRSALPGCTLVDHPGVHEDSRLAYINEVLVRRRGCPAACAVLLAEVGRQLLLAGAIDCALMLDFRDFAAPPSARPLLNLTRAQLLQPGSGALLNTCSSEALAELLRHLKRSYWPFSWDTNVDAPQHGGRASLGGFRAAAKAALGASDTSAALRAVSATAAHRLQRGIWTSPGAGDLRRCLAASERLVMMVGDEQPAERRDLAVLLLHAGRPAAAAAELGAYLDACKPWQRRLGASGLGASGAALDADPFGLRLASDLWTMLRDAGVAPAPEVLSTDAMLRSGGWPTDGRAEGPGEFQPLTW